MLPYEGYDIGVELWKDTPLDEVLETLSELGFERIQERNDGYEGNVEAELIEDIFEKFMSISRDYGESVKNIEEFYERWIDVGFNIVDLKNILEKNSKLKGEHDFLLIYEVPMSTTLTVGVAAAFCVVSF